MNLYTIALKMLMVLELAGLAWGQESGKGIENKVNIWEEIYCVGGEVLQEADLRVERGPHGDRAHLVVEVDTKTKGPKDGKWVFVDSMAKGVFGRMQKEGRIEMVLKSSESIELGGQMTKAVLLDLVRKSNGDYNGYLAMGGSVFELSCPREPQKAFAYCPSGR